MNDQNTNSSHNRALQKTLARSVPYVGIGLHTGQKVKMHIKPAEAISGINFVRTDIHGENSLLPARWYNVTDTTLSTSFGNEHGVSVATVEHLLAALRGCGIDNVLIEIDGPEVHTCKTRQRQTKSY